MGETPPPHGERTAATSLHKPNAHPDPYLALPHRAGLQSSEEAKCPQSGPRGPMDATAGCAAALKQLARRGEKRHSLAQKGQGGTWRGPGRRSPTGGRSLIGWAGPKILQDAKVGGHADERGEAAEDGGGGHAAGLCLLHLHPAPGLRRALDLNWSPGDGVQVSKKFTRIYFKVFKQVLKYTRVNFKGFTRVCMCI